MPTDAVSTSTRERLLDAAGELLQKVGYTSFSFRDLAVQVGIRSASIHYHFPTKTDLGLALVERTRARGRERERSLCAEYPDEGRRLLAVAGHIAALSCDRGWSCPIFVLQSEFPVLPPPVQDAVRDWVAEKLAMIAAWLAAGRRAGRLHFPGTAAAQARLVWAALEYGSQLCRTHPGESYLAMIRQLVDAMRPAPPRRRPATSRRRRRPATAR
jgi:TetR/AcrR family transcriptional regulator, transcriptional repressor for nem operon